MAKQRTKKAEEFPTTVDLASRESLISGEIATLAYHLWQTRGCPVGSPETDWFDAEQQLQNRNGASPTEQVNGPILARSSGA